MLTCTIYTSNRWQIFRISCAKTFENKLQKIVCILFGINSVIAISNVVDDINSAYSENLTQQATRDPLVIRFQSEVVKMARDSIRFQSEVVKMARDSNYCRLNLFHSICKRFLMQCVSKYLCLIYAKYYISFIIHDIICSTTFTMLRNYLADHMYE